MYNSSYTFDGNYNKIAIGSDGSEDEVNGVVDDYDDDIDADSNDVLMVKVMEIKDLWR